MVATERTYANETALSRAVQARFKALGGLARKVHSSGYTGAGEPDIDACLHGRAIKVELKQPGKVPTAIQLATLRKWEAAGALAGWVRSVTELNELLSHLDELGWVNPQLR